MAMRARVCRSQVPQSQPESGQWFKLITLRRPGQPSAVGWRLVPAEQVSQFALRIELPRGCRITVVR
jgi:hypothetical protein